MRRMRLLAELLALVAPPACVACSVPVGALEVLCSSCRGALPWLREELCARCALPAHGRCGCPARAAPWTRAWAPFAHAGPARQIVLALKFRGALGLADLMAAPIAAGAPPGLLAGATLVPVPAHPARQRARGFDHAELLARALSRRTGAPRNACLARRGPTGTQLGLGRAERLAHGRVGVCATRAPPAVALLVDDVHTTGATLTACGRALRAAGSEEVRVITYARTL